ncbi:MAG: hypothetical protein ACI80V_003688 [Rhodothermales bacterium]|jgi:hypothetical protein
MSLACPFSIVAVLAVSILTGCGPDHCDVELAPDDVGRGRASLSFRIVEEDGDAATQRLRMECVDVLVLNPSSYADTLAAGRFAVSSDRVRLSGLTGGAADVIVDRPGYYPAKFTGIFLDDGPNLMSERVLMFRTSIGMALPGFLGVTLRGGAGIEFLRRITGPFGKVSIRAAPGGHYEVQLAYRGRDGTRRDVESLLGQLVRSAYVEAARPLVTASAAMRPM